MCRNIRVLHHFDPPSTPEEIRAAALQYVRKVSGIREPSKSDLRAFEKAIDDVAKVTSRILDALTIPRTPARTREAEKIKARERWESRKSRIVASR